MRPCESRVSDTLKIRAVGHFDVSTPLQRLTHISRFFFLPKYCSEIPLKQNGISQKYELRGQTFDYELDLADAVIDGVEAIAKAEDIKQIGSNGRPSFFLHSFLNTEAFLLLST